MTDKPLTSNDDGPWERLRRLTPARIGLARAGASLATAPLLAFQLAHARARDAVHEQLDDARLAGDLASSSLPVLRIVSAAEGRQQFLMRPDLGRRLGEGAEAVLAPHRGAYDLVIVVADGLSARAVQTHAAPVLPLIVAALQREGWRIAPIVIVRQGRVAIGDAIAAALGAYCVALLVGERPGLSAPDSMGAYLTFKPHAGTTDADRNCISNIRPDGIGIDNAAFKIAAMLRAMRRRQISGVSLKDGTDALTIERGPLSPP